MYRDQGNAKKAEDLLKQAAGLDPNSIKCLYELASLYNTNGAPVKALLPSVWTNVIPDS